MRTQGSAHSMRLATSIVAATGLMIGCSFQINWGNHSGTTANPYVEEPLGEKVKSFALALELSNRVVDLFQKEKYGETYATCCDHGITSSMGELDFTHMMRSVQERVGPIVAYKPMQWAFDVHKSSEGSFLHSTKIVEHERGFVTYTLAFREDGPYDKCIGLNYRYQSGPVLPK